jgi:hypothetical protein
VRAGLVNRPEELPLQEQIFEKDVFMVNQCCGSAGANIAATA